MYLSRNPDFSLRSLKLTGLGEPMTKRHAGVSVLGCAIAMVPGMKLALVLSCASTVVVCIKDVETALLLLQRLWSQHVARPVCVCELVVSLLFSGWQLLLLLLLPLLLLLLPLLLCCFVSCLLAVVVERVQRSLNYNLPQNLSIEEFPSARICSVCVLFWIWDPDTEASMQVAVGGCAQGIGQLFAASLA